MVYKVQDKIWKNYMNLLHALKDFTADEVQIVAEAEQGNGGYGIVHLLAKFTKVPEVNPTLHPVFHSGGLKMR